jgi:hypothetical protein
MKLWAVTRERAAYNTAYACKGDEIHNSPLTLEMIELK